MIYISLISSNGPVFSFAAMRTFQSAFTTTLAALWPVVKGLPQSIASLESYQQLRPCVGSCFIRPGSKDLSDLLGIQLRCCEQYISCNGPVDDNCYCRADLRPTAVSWLSACVATRCSSNQVDFTSAVNVYDGYCSAAVPPAGRVTTTTPPTLTATPLGTAGGPGSGNTPSVVTIVATRSAAPSDSHLLMQAISTIVLVSGTTRPGPEQGLTDFILVRSLPFVPV